MFFGSQKPVSFMFDKSQKRSVYVFLDRLLIAFCHFNLKYVSMVVNKNQYQAGYLPLFWKNSKSLESAGNKYRKDKQDRRQGNETNTEW